MKFPGKKIACGIKIINIYYFLMTRIFKTSLRASIWQRIGFLYGRVKLAEKKSPHR